MTDECGKAAADREVATLKSLQKRDNLGLPVLMAITDWTHGDKVFKVLQFRDIVLPVNGQLNFLLRQLSLCMQYSHLSKFNMSKFNMSFDAICIFSYGQVALHESPASDEKAWEIAWHIQY